MKDTNMDMSTAIDTLLSMRGRILITQALILAVEELSKVEGAERQVGNIADMQLILYSDFAIDTRDDEETAYLGRNRLNQLGEEIDESHYEEDNPIEQYADNLESITSSMQGNTYYYD